MNIVNDVKEAWARQKRGAEMREKLRKEVEEETKRRMMAADREAYDAEYQRIKAAGGFKPSFPREEKVEVGSKRKRSGGGFETSDFQGGSGKGFGAPGGGDDKEDEDEEMADVDMEMGEDGSSGEEMVQEETPQPEDVREQKDEPSDMTLLIESHANTAVGDSINNTANTSRSVNARPGKPPTKAELKKRERAAKKVLKLEEQLEKALRDAEATGLDHDTIHSSFASDQNDSFAVADATPFGSMLPPPPPSPGKPKSKSKPAAKTPKKSAATSKASKEKENGKPLKGAQKANSKSATPDSTLAPKSSLSSLFSPRRSRDTSRPAPTPIPSEPAPSATSTKPANMRTHRKSTSFSRPRAPGTDSQPLQPPPSKEPEMTTEDFDAMMLADSLPGFKDSPAKKSPKSQHSLRTSSLAKSQTKSQREEEDTLAGIEAETDAMAIKSLTSTPAGSFNTIHDAVLPDDEGDTIRVSYSPPIRPTTPGKETVKLKSAKQVVVEAAQSKKVHLEEKVEVDMDETIDSSHDEGFSMVALSPMLKSTGSKGGLLGAAVNGARKEKGGGGSKEVEVRGGKGKRGKSVGRS